MPRELIWAPGHDRQRSVGYLVLDWIEHWCVHGPGDVEGAPVVLDDELAGYVLDLYAVAPDGRRLYDSAFFSRAKGRAKSELAAFVALAEAFAPCRGAGQAAVGGETIEWQGWHYEFRPGEPLARPVTYPFIRCLATEETQAGNTYDNIHFNLTEGPLSEGLPRDAAGLTRTLLPHGGEIVPSTAASASKDGGKETHAVFDETHLYVTPDLRRMYATVRRNMAKRKDAEPWSHETSTMYAPGEDSVAEASHGLARSIKAGKTRAARMLFDHREAPPGVDLADEQQLHAALTEVYGPFAEAMDLSRIINEIWDPRNSVADSIRYWLNQPHAASDSWVTHDQVHAMVDVTKAVTDRDRIVLGFDGSRGRVHGVADSTVLVGIRLRDRHAFVAGAWEEPEGPAGKNWEVSERAVDAAVRNTMARYDVVGYFADPSGWSEKVAAWTSAYGSKMKVKVTPEQPIRWKTNQHARWADTLKSLHDAIVYGQLSCADNPVLTTHLKHARRRPTRSGITIAKEHPGSTKKIDAAVALAYAWAAYLEAVAKGLDKQRAGYGARRLN